MKHIAEKVQIAERTQTAERSGTRKGQRAGSAASTIRSQIENGGERYWRVSDFVNLSAAAASQTLSRLAREKLLTRAGKGLYYHPRQTALGPSRPAQSDILQSTLQRMRPAGRTAANLLGFTTQNAARGEFATASNSISRSAFPDGQARIYTRRPENWKTLSETDAALLDFLRSRGTLSELSPEQTKARLLALLREPERFARLALAARDEPPRVRAMLGAIGQEIGQEASTLQALKATLNPLSRFDFGALAVLVHAREWQAKHELGREAK